MKTIIIDLPDDLSDEGITRVLTLLAFDIRRGALVPTSTFHHALHTADGPISVRGATGHPPAADNQAHPPLNTPLSAFTPAMLDALPVGSAFGAGEEVSGVMVKDDRGWRPAAGGRYAPDFGAPGWDQTRPLIRVGPEQASEPAPTTHTTGRLLRDFTIDELRALPAGSRFGPTDDGEYFIKGRDGVWRVRMTSLAEEGEDAMLNMWGTDEPPLAFVAPGEPTPLPDPWPNMVAEVEAYDGCVPGWRRCTVYTVQGIGGVVTVNAPPIPWTPDHIREVRTPDGTTLWKRPAANGGAR